MRGRMKRKYREKVAECAIFHEEFLYPRIFPHYVCKCLRLFMFYVQSVYDFY